jgi:hypothetical protein
MLQHAEPGKSSQRTVKCGAILGVCTVGGGGGHVPSLNGMYGKDVHYRVFEFKLSNMHHLQCKNINAKKSKSRETFNLVQSCATMGKIHKQEKGRKKQK